MPGPLHAFRFRADGDRVLLVVNGQGVRIPFELAIELGRQLIATARTVESSLVPVMERQASDQALLLRRGVGIGLSADSRVQREALHRATYDRDLRRAIPSDAALGGIASRADVGAPAVVDLTKTPAKEIARA